MNQMSFCSAGTFWIKMPRWIKNVSLLKTTWMNLMVAVVLPMKIIWRQ